MTNRITSAWVSDVAHEKGFDIVESVDIPAESPGYLLPPPHLHKDVSSCLRRKYPVGIYTHQSLAVQEFLDGHDVCLSTSTASGKSLVFMTAAAHITMTDPNAKVLALYPAKALIQDQMDKWQDFLAPLSKTLGYIDGDVKTGRDGILRNNQIVMMTPDVTHAWLMSNLNDPTIRRFTQNLRLLILDEAHVYDGVFGTNMAYFLRRLQVACGDHRLICSTATLGAPSDFVQQLTGRDPVCFGLEEDRSSSPGKTLLLARVPSRKSFESTVSLLVSLANADRGRFLAFGDSRKMVERIVAATHRRPDSDDDEEDEDTADAQALDTRILPYRAGYENDDRIKIQKALTEGTLSGVVSTSAMELGIDIGDIDLVMLLTTPPSIKSFWQRLGRTGRRHPGTCLVIDTRGAITESSGGLRSYMTRPMEPNWLYLENRYIQYTNALCAAVEFGALGLNSAAVPTFMSLPSSFRRFLGNEINPAEIVDADLFEFKQRALAGPHYEFPIRNGVEKAFQVKNGADPMGTVTMSQALREAYPGAVYYYMARPYRVTQFRYKTGDINTIWEKHLTTQPIAQAMVFPRFQGGILQLQSSPKGFIAETEMQVSERVLGFVEQRGKKKEEHRYNPMSRYSQQPISRFLTTTGVCWYFPDLSLSEPTGTRILETFCTEFGLQERDIGCGQFHARCSPLAAEPCQGLCIFDATNGSLRLTQKLAEHFSDVIDAAIASIQADDDQSILRELRNLQTEVRDIKPTSASMEIPTIAGDGDVVLVVARGEQALLFHDGNLHGGGPKEVCIRDYRYTPNGLVYELEPEREGQTRWAVPAEQVQPMHGLSKMVRLNLVTWDEEEV